MQILLLSGILFYNIHEIWRSTPSSPAGSIIMGGNLEGGRSERTDSFSHSKETKRVPHSHIDWTELRPSVESERNNWQGTLSPPRGIKWTISYSSHKLFMWTLNLDNIYQRGSSILSGTGERKQRESTTTVQQWGKDSPGKHLPSNFPNGCSVSVPLWWAADTVDGQINGIWFSKYLPRRRHANIREGSIWNTLVKVGETVDCCYFPPSAKTRVVKEINNRAEWQNTLFGRLNLQFANVKINQPITK